MPMPSASTPSKGGGRCWTGTLAARLGHRGDDAAVAAVDVVAEHGPAGAADADRAIGHVQGHRFGKAIVRLLPGRDHLLHLRLVEARAALEHLLCEIERVLQADAAVAEVATALGEQPAVRRVVHVDAVLVGEAE